MRVIAYITVFATVAFAALIATQAPADIVYLKNGNSYEGTIISRTDTQVVIKVRNDQVEIPTEDVLHITFEKRSASAPAPVVPGQPRPQTAPAPAGPRSQEALAGLESKPFSTEDTTQPETLVFMLMRSLAGAPPGSGAFEIRRQIEQWRIAAHDRKRRAGTRWASPKEVAALRGAYADVLKEAQSLATHAAQGRGRSGQSAEAQRQLAGAMTKIQEAALKWPDPLLREFLLGLAAYQAKNYTLAADRFRNCSQTAPRVAGFRQAHGAAMMELQQHIEAVSEFTDLLRLLPGSRDANQLLRIAMKRTPGGLTNEAAYVEAQKLLDEYETPEAGYYTRRGQTWLMPGRAWYVTDRLLLPSPPYDRLIFRQGVAVPVDKQTLMLDAEVVRDAKEVFVRLNSKTVVGARIRKPSYFGTKTKEDPLAFVQVTGVELLPLKFDKATRARPGEVVTFHGISLYDEMGRAVRSVGTTVKFVADDGAVKLADGLAAGEAAAPVVTADGRLLTFLVGKTDVKADDGGTGLAMPPNEIADVMDRGRRGSSLYSSYGQVNRKASAAPLVANGSAFVVYATAVEKLD
jgi:tetratricopeptide (TPR) repeat protein